MLLLLAIGPLLQAAAAAQPRAARDDGPAVQHRHRHRQRPPGAAGHRRRAGLPRRATPPSPRRCAAPACGVGAAAVRARRAAGAAARDLRGDRGLARRPLRRPGPDHARRAGRLLRLRRVPADAAAHRDRVRQQGDPRVRRSAPDRAGARARARDRRPGRASCPARSRVPTWSTCPPASGVRRRPAHRDRQRAARARRRDRRPAGALRRGRRPLGWRRARGPLPRAMVRRRIVVSDTGAMLFSGRLADQVDIRLQRPGDAGRGDGTRRRRTTCWTRCPTDSTPRWPRRAARSPAASGSGWCWRVP